MGCTQYKYVDRLLSETTGGRYKSRKISLREASARYMKAERKERYKD